jgi:hypothetical protein
MKKRLRIKSAPARPGPDTEHEPSPLEMNHISQVIDPNRMKAARDWIATSAAPPRDDVLASTLMGIQPAAPWRSRKCLAVPFSVPPSVHGPRAVRNCRHWLVNSRILRPVERGIA